MPSDISNLVNMVFKFGDWANTIWNFHIVASVAILGWLFSHREKWNVKQKAILTIVYLSFVGINLTSQIEIHRLLGLTLNEVKAAIGQVPFRTEELNKAILNLSPMSTPKIIMVHLVMDIAVLICIWTNILKREADAKA